MVKLSKSWVKAIAETSSWWWSWLCHCCVASIIEATFDKKEESKKFASLIFFSMGMQLVNLSVFKFWYTFFYNFSATNFHTQLPHLLDSALRLYFYFMMVPLIASSYVISFSTYKQVVNCRWDVLCHYYLLYFISYSHANAPHLPPLIMEVIATFIILDILMLELLL